MLDRRAGVAVALAALAATTTSATAAAPDSGISGTVRGAPRCAAGQRDCRHTARQLTVVIRSARTHRVMRTLHPDGARFRVALRPGRYVVRASAGEGAVAATLAIVHRHDYTSVELDLHHARPT